MTFSKWHPDRPDAPRKPGLHERRAWALRIAWYTSTAMLVAGYFLMFWQLNA